MSSDPLAQAPAPPLPDGADPPRIVPRRRSDRWTTAATGTATAVVLVPLGLAVTMAATVRYTVVTSLPGVGRHDVGKHHARGTEATR